MAEKNFNTRMQQKIDTTENWDKAINFVPKKGEIIVYSDGGGTGVPKMKVGDGTTKVGSLKFIESDGKLPAGRKISLGTAVSSTATEFDGSKDITIPVNSVYSSYLDWGGRNLTNSISPIDAALSYIHSANRLQFAKPDGITIEYSTNSGSTWTDYSASNSQKISLVSGLSVDLFLGKRTSGTTATTDALRITLNATNCGVYAIGRALLINFTTGGATGSKVKIETSTIGAPTTFTDHGSYDISGWSGWNSYPLDIGAFGGSAAQTYQIDNIRLTFTIDGAPPSGERTAVLNLLLFGETAWGTPSDMARTGHLYSWDVNQNVVFPGKLTATNLVGALANSFNFNGKTFDNTAPVNFGTIGIAYGGTAASTRKDALTNLLGQEETTNLNEALDQGKYQWSDNATNYPAGEQYGTLLNLTHYESSNTTYNYFTQIAIGTHGTIHWRDKINAANFSEWRKILDSANYTDYAATKNHNHDGVYLKSVPIASSSTLGGVKVGSGLAVAADGTISVASAPKLTTGRNITIGSKTLAFDGSAALTYSLADIGAASTSSLNNYMPLSGGMFTGGVQFGSINYPLSWTAGTTSDITLTLAPNQNDATSSQHLYLPLKTGTLATCSKSTTLVLTADGWSDDGKFTITLPEPIDSTQHTVIICPNPKAIIDADTYAAYAAAQIVPIFESETSLILHAYGTIPTFTLQIIITQID